MKKILRQLPPLKIRAERLTEALIHFLLGSPAMMNEGSFSISTKCIGNVVYLRLLDHGGEWKMPDLLPNAERESGEETGLRLAREIILEEGGKIFIRNRRKRGSSLLIKFTGRS